ncbi:MAG TPA: phospholipase D-like domain-containing protein [Steroidobacteraceae bacterium]|nr:phospholipase D-like domain-containing protein [Steroidobacteraceae bacterium]
MSGWIPPVTGHSLAIVLSLLTYVLTTRAEHERRPPSIAISWVLGLIALPYLALPMYLMFGRRKLPRKIAPCLSAPSGAVHWAETLIESFGLPGPAPAQVRMHADGAEARDALFELMSRATRRLDVCTYILGNDAFGEEVTARLIGCVRRGVRVRFLIDGVGALALPRHWHGRMRGAGAETAVFSPLLARETQGPRNLRNHRKWLIADGELLWAGGRNLAAEYFCGAPGIKPWADLTFDLDGPVAASAANQFEVDWCAAGGKPAAHSAVSAVDETVARAQFLPSGPDQAEDTVRALLIDACFHATERLLAVTPYFVPDSNLETAIRLAVRRGVKVALCIPAKSNHRLADFVRNRSLRALASAGASVHLLRSMNHAKAVVFDRSLGICGSANLDSRSLLLNYESAVVFYGKREIEWLASWINDLIADAAPFDNRPPALWRDLAEGLLLTIAYQL